MSNLYQSAKFSSSVETAPAAYQVGDRDDRPWGYYTVTGVGTDPNGEEYCEKTIVIKPGHVLSLQSHNLRREKWTVKKGTLTALLDGQRVDVLPHESLHIPAGSIHCMANLDDDNCLVEERQEGICREEDIKRYMDAYQRATEKLASPTAEECVAAYRMILDDIRKISVNRSQGAPY